MIQVHIEMEQTKEDLELLLNKFLDENEAMMSKVLDVDVVHNPDGTWVGTITYEQ